MSITSGWHIATLPLNITGHHSGELFRKDATMCLLEYPALVLNADFQPIRLHPLSLWSFEKTVSAVVRGRVMVLEEYEAVLHSANATYKPPSVIALKQYVKVPSRVAFNRINIFLRDDFRCQYCGEKFTTNELTFDHVIPRSKGGSNTMGNVVAACAPCNSKKSDQIWKPLTAPIVPNSKVMARKAALRKDLIKGQLHADWISYLYWSGVLQEDH